MVSELLPVFVLVFFISVTLIVLIVMRSFRKRRLNRILQNAKKLGFNPVPIRGEALDGIIHQDFLLLAKVQNRSGGHIEYLLEGAVNGNKIYLFDYAVINPHETNATQTVIVIQNNSNTFPEFALVPRKMKKERFTQRLRTAPFEFASRVVNSYRKIDTRIEGYNLSCPAQSEQPVLELVNGEIIDYFSGHRKYTVEGCGDKLLMYQRECLISPNQLEAFIQECLSIHRLFLTSALGDGRNSIKIINPGAGLPSARR